MKFKFLNGSILLILLCGISVFSQKNTITKQLEECRMEVVETDENMKFDAAFVDVTVGDVFDRLTIRTGLPFVVDPAVRENPVSIEINETNWRQLLDVIVLLENLDSYLSKRGTIEID